jgi:hypothetical protein
MTLGKYLPEGLPILQIGRAPVFPQYGNITAIGIEHLQAVVLVVGHIHDAISINGNTGRAIKLPFTMIVNSPQASTCTALRHRMSSLDEVKLLVGPPQEWPWHPGPSIAPAAWRRRSGVIVPL